MTLVKWSLIRHSLPVRIPGDVDAVGAEVHFLSHDPSQNEFHVEQRNTLGYQISARENQLKLNKIEENNEFMTLKRRTDTDSRLRRVGTDLHR